MLASYENIPLWHERDISHSSVERIVIPDAVMLLDYMLNRYTKVLNTLTVFEERMLKNIYITNGVIFSQRILSMLIEKGLSREEAYDTVQPLSMKSWEEGLAFKELLLNSTEIATYLDSEEIKDAFDINYFLKNVETIYRRVGVL
jgi:adenylosuccinate lyase